MTFAARPRVLLTADVRKHLVAILREEREENPDAVFHIREVRRGVHDKAVDALRLGLDSPEATDVLITSAGIDFAISADYLELFGEPGTFAIGRDAKGGFSVCRFHR